MSEKVRAAMDSFIHKLIEKNGQENTSLLIDYDPAWPSLCYVNQGSSGEKVAWLPVKQTSALVWQDFESALNLSLHPSIKTFYECYWSEHLQAIHPSGPLSLIQLWNNHDFAVLQQNLIGHILMKRRLKQSETVFFALTEEEDFILSVHNNSGEVMLEQIGLEPKKVIAPDLATFLESIEPSIEH